MLRALAAGEMRHERKTSCCRAAEQPAIRAGGSIDQAANLQVADEVSFRGRLFNVRFRKCSKMFIDARKEHLGTIGLSNEKLDQICFWETKGGKL